MELNWTMLKEMKKLLILSWTTSPENEPGAQETTYSKVDHFSWTWTGRTRNYLY